MKYSQEQIDKANSMDIVKVAEDLGVDVKQHGNTHMALCLWHDERQPSMQVGGKHNTCHCFSLDQT